jgi:hypothetical protein
LARCKSTSAVALHVHSLLMPRCIMGCSMHSFRMVSGHRSRRSWANGEESKCENGNYGSHYLLLWSPGADNAEQITRFPSPCWRFTLLSCGGLAILVGGRGQSCFLL